LFAAFAVVGAVAAVAELSTPAFATKSNFNNQQSKSNFECMGCNP
jgi:hypothetical protein